MMTMRTETLSDVKTIVSILKSRNEIVATMESCTAGLLSTLLTNVEGSSAILKMSSVTYSNEGKIAAGVPASIIDTYGVYSLETAEAMASTQVNKGNDWGIGVTGSLGNLDPNNKDSEIGIVYYCITNGTTKYSTKLSVPREYTSRFSQKEYVCNQIIETFRGILAISEVEKF